MSSHYEVARRAGPSAWRLLSDHPLLVGLLLLLPIVWLLGPVPIDETRYLAVAWEMHRTGDFLVPHLNGATYAHKPPLLFWLINLGWLVTGVQAWTARALILGCSIASVLLLRALTERLGGAPRNAIDAMWLLLGTVYFAAFANAIMFDVLLTTCVLLAAHGLLDLAQGSRRTRGIVLTGLAIGLGILAKGPVMLLFVAVLAFGAPWWSDRLERGRRARFFGHCALALLLGAAISLSWAVLAAIHGGQDYARAIFLSQTLDRIEGVAGKSTHGRPWWWYGVVFPLMLLPWPLVIRPRWQALRGLLREPAVRLAVVWVVPTFLVFSMIGGKQPHYLLPVIPAVALGLAFALDRGAVQVRSGLLAVFLILLGAALAAAPRFATIGNRFEYLGDTTPAWGAALIALGLLMAVFSRQSQTPAMPGLAALALVLLVKLAVIEGPGQRYDLHDVATRIASAQERGQPIVHLGWHHGVYEFAGRLTRPLPALLTLDELADWTHAHPDGLVVSFNRGFRFRAQPVFTQPFRGSEVSIWNAREAVESGMDAKVTHTRDPDEED